VVMVGVRQRSCVRSHARSHSRQPSSSRNPHQLRDCNCRVRIVHLDGDFLRKRTPIGVAAAIASYDVSQGAGREKIFLHEAQSLAGGGRVVRIQHSRKEMRFEAFGHCADKLAMAERLEVEILSGISRPEAQRVDFWPPNLPRSIKVVMRLLAATCAHCRRAPHKSN